MFAVLAEDKSDAEALSTLIKRICASQNLSISKWGFRGGGNLRKEAPQKMRLYAQRGVKHFVICHDSDGTDPLRIRSRVEQSIAPVSHLCPSRFIAVPVEELEAWLIADESAIARAIPTLRIKSQPNPEHISNPKEWLIRNSRAGRPKPRYRPTIHNPMVAQHLDLDRVRKKCPSFDELASFLEGL